MPQCRLQVQTVPASTAVGGAADTSHVDVKVRAARSGKGDSEVIEEALRRELGFDLLERLWQRDDIGEEDALELAVEAQHATRPD